MVGGIVNTTGLHPVDPELAERSAAETAESAVFIFPSMKMDLLSLVCGLQNLQIHISFVLKKETTDFQRNKAKFVHC